MARLLLLDGARRGPGPTIGPRSPSSAFFTPDLSARAITFLFSGSFLEPGVDAPGSPERRRDPCRPRRALGGSEKPSASGRSLVGVDPTSHRPGESLPVREGSSPA